MIKHTTIVAVATPPGIGALAVIRISGFDAFKIFSKIIKQKDKFFNTQVRLIHQYYIIDSISNDFIDEITAIKYKAPNSFTGEDIVEIISHGGNLTVKNIIKQLINNGAEIAGKGDFSKRAFLNGKLDLIKAEAIKTLIESQNEHEHANAVSLYSGVYKKLLKWQELLQQELSYCEAEIEFGEAESIEPKQCDNVLEICRSVQEEIHRIKKFREIKNGINIVIAGPVNAGKSSLFNYLLGYKRAIVHDQPGTTRDFISGKIDVDGKEVNLFDTAGIRSTSDIVEKEGIKISEELIAKAHLIIWITDLSDTINLEELTILNSLNKQKTVILLNKMDKSENILKITQITSIIHEYLKISINEKMNLKKLAELLLKRINRIYSETPAPDIFINERHEKIAKKIHTSLKKAIKNWNFKEIATFYLRECLVNFEELYGKTDNEKIINNIFDTFCIGK